MKKMNCLTLRCLQTDVASKNLVPGDCDTPPTLMPEMELRTYFPDGSIQSDFVTPVKDEGDEYNLFYFSKLSLKSYDRTESFGLTNFFQPMKKTFPSREDLICFAYVFNSHDDFSVVENLYTGFDSGFNLIVVCEHIDYDYPEYNCATYAIVKKEEAYCLAKRLKVSLHDLPKEISDAMSDWHEIACAVPNDVRACFKEITECLIDEDCHFTITRKPAQNGFITC